MKVVVIRTAPTPARERGAKEMRDFRLHSGYNIVVVNMIIHNCRELKTPFNPIDWARLEVTSPKHKV
jgi:hypothetical protein